MSFLNPISEPVLMYSSTDANAPQINLAARTAGDVKTVLKACLVTGYGTKQGAGWSIQNETATVAEFVSPSALMSDYRFGVDDNSTSSTIFYYMYQNAKQGFSYANTPKNPQNTTLNSPKNAWTLLVTAQGILWIEKFLHAPTNLEMCRVFYWGRVKSALINDAGKNISMYIFGYGAQVGTSSAFFSNNGFYHIALANYTSCDKNGANISALQNPATNRSAATIELTNSVFLSSSGILLGEMMPILMTRLNDNSNLFGMRQVTFNGRPALYICIGSSNSTSIKGYFEQYCDGCYVYLDTWGY